jgi:hypothetical protein
LESYCYSTEGSCKQTDNIKIKSETQIVISSKLLLSVYLVVPVCMILIVIDLFFLEKTLLNLYFKENPEHMMIWTVLFIMPHIIASFITLADKEYLQHYQRKLWVPFLVVLLFVCYIGTMPYGFSLFLLFFVFYNMYHIIAQQFGLTLMFLRHKPNWRFQCWKWFSALAATNLYFVAYHKSWLKNKFILGFPIQELITMIAFLLIASSILMAVLIYREARPPKFSIGSNYLLMNIAMCISAYIATISEYTFF